MRSFSALRQFAFTFNLICKKMCQVNSFMFLFNCFKWAVLEMASVFVCVYINERESVCVYFFTALTSVPWLPTSCHGLKPNDLFGHGPHYYLKPISFRAIHQMWTIITLVTRNYSKSSKQTQEYYFIFIIFF